MTRRFYSVIILLVLVSSVASSSAQATEVGRGRDFGLGLALGSPSGIVGKVFAGPTEALDFGLGFRNYGYRCNHRHGCGNEQLSVHADYLWQNNLLMEGNVVLDWHIGVGGRVWFYDYNDNNDNDLAVAARMPIGIDLMFRRPSFLEVFLEIGPSLWVVPGLYLNLDSALGVRFYF
ncbi:MAG: hypothetical protein SGI86_01435 [Deltaproteobacteria bacterium]|nr:hypothetical protein [Deltaproteobacteria bacterium]